MYENDRVVAYWEVPLFADTTRVKANRINMWIIDKERKEVKLLEMSCPWVENREEKAMEKTRKYGPLRWELQQRYPDYKVTQHNIIIDVLRGYSQDLTNTLPPRDITDASNALNQDLLEISRWCCENSLLINPDKTKFLVIATPQLLHNLPRLSITILGKEIEPVSVARDLGVYIDQTLNYNEHISKLVSNCVHKLVQINRIKHLLDRKSLLLMINAFVFSKLFYCSTVWGNTSKSNIKKLQLVQNFAGKIVLGLKKFDHISQGLKSLGWLSIEDKLRLNTAVMVHKCLQHRVPIYLKDKFVYRSQVHNRQLRSVDNNELNLPHCRLSTGQRSFAFRGAKVWNSLPLDLKLTSSLRTFKKNVCELLVNNLS